MVTNNSTNQNVSDAFHNLESVEFRIMKISLYVLIFTLSCIGNSLVAIVIIRAKGIWTSANLLIFNLAFCDLVTPTLSIPFDLALEEVNYIWPFGRGMCKVLWPFQTAFSTSSSLTLAAISLDRFRTLAKPFTGRVSTGHNLLFLLTIHGFSISLCIPYFIALDYNASASEGSCDESWSSFAIRQAYTVTLFLCQYALPLITMSIAYLLIYRSLRSNFLRLFSTYSERGRPQNAGRMSIMESMEFKRKEQNIRLAKMFVIVVVVFAISTFPNQVLWLWVDFGNGAENKFFHYISVVCRLFTYANSVLNPFIYALKSREFRSGFARIGRSTVMQPLRKISNGTRKIARKVSGRNVLDNPHTNPVAMKPAAACSDTSDGLFKTLGHEPSQESSNHLQITRKPTGKNPYYEIREPSDKAALCEDPGLPPVIRNGSVYDTWEGMGRHGDEITNNNCISGVEYPNNSLENMSIINDHTTMIQDTHASTKLRRLFEELPETDC